MCVCMYTYILFTYIHTLYICTHVCLCVTVCICIKSIYCKL